MTAAARGSAVASLTTLRPHAVFEGTSDMVTEQELMKLSRQKWDWLVHGELATLEAHIDEQCMFVHMGATTDSPLQGQAGRRVEDGERGSFAQGTARHVPPLGQMVERARLEAVNGAGKSGPSFGFQDASYHSSEHNSSR